MGYSLGTYRGKKVIYDSLKQTIDTSEGKIYYCKLIGNMSKQVDMFASIFTKWKVTADRKEKTMRTHRECYVMI